MPLAFASFMVGLALTRVRAAAWFSGGYRGYARYGYGYGRRRPRAALEEGRRA